MITILAFIFSIFFIVFTSTRLKVYPFLSLILGALIFGLITGMPLNSIIENINSGFGGTIGNIGIIIILGIIIGAFLENSGGAEAIANVVLKVLGRKNVHAAMASIGYIVSIPVFADSGFVILSSLNRVLTKKAGLSLVGTSVALALGLTATHTMVPPTPGPIAAASILSADLGLVILLGMVTSFVALIIPTIYARYCGTKMYVDPGLKAGTEVVSAPVHQPTALKSLVPILLPIVLIVLKSLADFPSHPFGEGQLRVIIGFIGNPLLALLIGVFFSFLLPAKFEMNMLSTEGWTGKALMNAGTIIIITGAGGAFGKILQSSEIANLIGENITGAGIGIWLPFLIAAAIKTAQGSSTVAIITTAAIVAPLMTVLGFTTEISKAMAVIAIGAGSAVVSHANDSFFWVILTMSGLNIKQGYRSHTIGTLILGLSAICFLSVLSIFI
ncbi:MAG TPA: GntP family permease [Bacteroidales bacterium]|nr:GntP family permease [Bacteroidales bacterium]